MAVKARIKQLVNRLPLWERMLIVDALAPILAERKETIRIIDGGAGSAPLPCDCWYAIPPHLLLVYGFDIDAREAEKMNQAAKQAGRPEQYWGAALWSQTGRQTFRHTHVPGGSSLLKPNQSVVGRLRSTDGTCLGEVLRVEQETEVPCTTVDDWRASCHIPTIDFLKLNVQGGELPVLKGASSTLPEVVGLQLEASFIESYTGQPFFADLAIYLRETGFVFFDFLAPNLVGRMKSPVTFNLPQIAGGFRWPSRQIFEGHFLWLRDPIANGATISDAKILKLACIAEIYGQIEYAFELLAWQRDRYASDGQKEEASALDAVIRLAANRYRKIANSTSFRYVVRRIIKHFGRLFAPDSPLFLR